MELRGRVAYIDKNPIRKLGERDREREREKKKEEREIGILCAVVERCGPSNLIQSQGRNGVSYN